MTSPAQIACQDLILHVQVPKVHGDSLLSPSPRGNTGTARMAGRNRGPTRRTRTLTGTATAAAPAHAHERTHDPAAALDPSGCGREAGGSHPPARTTESTGNAAAPAPTTAPPLTPRAAALPFPPRVPFVPHLVGDRRAPTSPLLLLPSRSPVHLTLTLPQPPSCCLPSSSSSLRGRQPGQARRQTDAAHLLPLPLPLPPRHQNKVAVAASRRRAQRSAAQRSGSAA